MNNLITNLVSILIILVILFLIWLCLYNIQEARKAQTRIKITQSDWDSYYKRHSDVKRFNEEMEAARMEFIKNRKETTWHDLQIQCQNAISHMDEIIHRLESEEKAKDITIWTEK